jgi:hypothetical protein
MTTIERIKSEPLKFWGLLELMGHRRLAGEITKDDGGMIRIDLPSGQTQWYGTAAVYCITPTTEETARGMGAGIGSPIGVYDARQILEGHYAEREASVEDRERIVRAAERGLPAPPSPAECRMCRKPLAPSDHGLCESCEQPPF